jgi:hypothetical protein
MATLDFEDEALVDRFQAAKAEHPMAGKDDLAGLVPTLLAVGPWAQ